VKLPTFHVAILIMVYVSSLAGYALAVPRPFLTPPGQRCALYPENALALSVFCIDEPMISVWGEFLQPDALPSSLQTDGLLIVLTLILWITGYLEYCRTYLSEIYPKLNAYELKLLLIEACVGIQQSVTDQATDQWRVCLNASVKAKGKHWKTCFLWCAVPELSMICYETYTLQFFVLQLLTSHDF